MGITASKKRIAGIILLSLVWIIFVRKYLFSGLVPFPADFLVTFFPPWSAYYQGPVTNGAMPDIITQIYPWKNLTIHSWSMGQIPLWNPYGFSGTYHAGNYQTAVFSPLNIVYFILPFIDAWSLLVLLQPLLAGFFTFMLLRSLKRSMPASLVGSVSFMFCGFIVTWMAYGTLSYAALFLPFILWALVRFFEKQTVLTGTWISLGVALSFLSGHFQISLYVLSAGVLFTLYKALVHNKPKQAAVSVLFLFLGIGLAAPQVLASLHAFSLSARSSLIQFSAIRWEYLPTILAPDFYGNPVTRNDWFGYYAEWASFFGTVSFFLGVYAFLFYRNKTTGYFLLIWLIGFLFAYPTIFNNLIYILHIPSLSTSYAPRIIVLFSFGGSVAAAFGYDGLIDDWKRRRLRRLILFSLLIISVIAGLWIFLYASPFVPLEHIMIGRRNLLLPTVMSTAFAVLLFLGYRFPVVVRFCIIALVVFDMLRFAVKWMPFENRNDVFPTLKVIEYLTQNTGENRIYGNVGNELNTMFRLQGIEGYDAMNQKRYGEFILSAGDGLLGEPSGSVVLLNKNGKYADKVLSFLGVRYIVHRLSDGTNVWAYPYWKYDHYDSVFKDEKYEVLLNTQAYPRSYLVSDYRIETDNQKILDMFYSPDTDLKNSVILEEHPQIQPGIGPGDTSIISYTPNRVVIETESAVPKILVLTDVYDKGWKVYVDKAESRLLRANYDFRAVALPQGIHIVEFVYRPTEVSNGLLIFSVIALGLLGGTLLRYGYRNIRSLS